jgi:hypothetical protein
MEAPKAIVAAASNSPIAALERIDDARPRRSAPTSDIRGGTALLARRRRPVRPGVSTNTGSAPPCLPAPTFGLDALARGSLLHAALEAFWAGRGWPT